MFPVDERFIVQQAAWKGLVVVRVVIIARRQNVSAAKVIVMPSGMITVLLTF